MFLAMAVMMLALFSLQIAVFAQDATEEPTPEPTALPPTATFVPSEEGVLTIWSDQDRLPAIQALADSFTEQYGVEVRIQTMGFGDIRNNLVLGGPVGEGPDIIIGAHDWVGQLYTNGLIAPLELPEEILANLDPVALRAFTYEGELVGLPYLTEAVAVIYNTDLIPEFPETWEELTATAEELVASGEAERGLAIPNTAGDPYHHEALLTGFGGYIFGTDEEGSYNPDDVGIDSEGGVAAMTELDRLVDADILNPAVDGGVAQNLFTEGQLAAWITGPWSLNAVRESGVPYAVAPIPMMEDTPRPFVGSQGFMINAFSENLLLAQAFLTEFVATDEGMQLLYDTIPFIPAWNPLAATVDNEDLANFRLSVANGDPMPAIPEMNAVWTAWGNAITLIYQQQADPETVVADAAGAIRDEIASSGS
jgi:maltose/maltodextrin transport system substrate-binding protein/arabinogalactan oligomer/maltooligosaccharide transport system substrate-binding protein